MTRDDWFTNLCYELINYRTPQICGHGLTPKQYEIVTNLIVRAMGRAAIRSNVEFETWEQYRKHIRSRLIDYKESPMPDKTAEVMKLRACSFCNNAEDRVNVLIQSKDEVYICDGCILACISVIKTKRPVKFAEEFFAQLRKELDKLDPQRRSTDKKESHEHASNTSNNASTPETLCKHRCGCC